MQLKFRHKVFLAFLLNSLAVVICMLLVGSYYASRNFEEYVGKVEMERLGQMADLLSQEYQKDKSWEPVLAHWGHWVRVAAIGPGRPSEPVLAGESPFSFPLPPPVPHQRRGPEAVRQPPFKDLPPPPYLLPPGPRPMAAHIVLFDADKRPLTGVEEGSGAGYRLQPIEVDGRVVGWLAVRRLERMTHPLELEFVKHQSRTFYTVGGAALLLALVVTLILAHHLLAPVRELAEGTRDLMHRRFDRRIPVRTQDEFGQLATDFNNLAQALERYEQMRRQWLADMSHELRTPLAILRCEIEAMQDGVKEVTEAALDSLHFEVLHVSRIVHDLHDLSLIESGPMETEQAAVSPLEILQETLRSFQTRFERHGIRIETDVETLREQRLMADPGRLKQLFSNLLENTLRYVPPPGVLKIFHESGDGCERLHFEDTGPGVPAESLGRLFDRLYRVDKARSRAQGGSGLGLAICKSIVERFGGSIEASNVASGGLRITLVFPEPLGVNAGGPRSGATA